MAGIKGFTKTDQNVNVGGKTVFYYKLGEYQVYRTRSSTGNLASRMFLAGMDPEFSSYNNFLLSGNLYTIGVMSSYAYGTEPDRHICLKKLNVSSLVDQYFVSEIDISENNYTISSVDYALPVDDRIVVLCTIHYSTGYGMGLLSIDGSNTIINSKIIYSSSGDINFGYNDFPRDVFSSNGKLFVVKTDSLGVILTTYDKTLTKLWSSRIEYADYPDLSIPKAYADLSGNTFLAIGSRTVLKFNSSGTKVADFNLTGASNANHFDIAVDSTGKVFFHSDQNIHVLDSSLNHIVSKELPIIGYICFDLNDNLIVSSSQDLMSVDTTTWEINYDFATELDDGFAESIFCNVKVYGSKAVSSRGMVYDIDLDPNFSVETQLPGKDYLAPVLDSEILPLTVSTDNISGGSSSTSTDIVEMTLTMLPLTENTSVIKRGIFLVDGPNVGEYSFIADDDTRGSVVSMEETQNHRIAKVS